LNDTIPAIDPATLPETAQQILSGRNARIQLMAARGVVPGLRPDDLLAVIVALASGPPSEITSQAQATLAALPEPILKGVFSADLPPACIDALVHHYTNRIDVMEAVLIMPRVAIESVLHLAARGDEMMCELVATNQERLIAYPKIIERLYLNKFTRMSTADRLVEFAVRNGIELRGIAAWQEAARAIKGELIAEAAVEALPEDAYFRETAELAERLADDVIDDVYVEDDEGVETLEERMAPLFKRLAGMTVSQKVRRAMLGSKEERMMLVREQNRVVATAAARSPLMQEPEAVLIARNRSVSVDVLRILATTPAWMKCYQVKKHLVENSKTPISIAQHLVNHLRESDLRKLSKNKNVSGAIQLAAKRHLDRRRT
jgi:hypothetical protein